MPDIAVATRVRVVIVDDEPLARDCIREALSHEADVDIVGEAGNGRRAVELIRRVKPDVVFLDVQMPGQDGFAVIEEIGVDAMPVVVLVTAFDQYALRAFDVHALDYVLKPFDDDRFHRALSRARTQVAGRSDDDRARLRLLLKEVLREAGTRTAHDDTEGYAKRLMVREGDRIRFVPVQEIDFLEADGNNVRLHVGKAAIPLRCTMREIAARLDPTMFVRVHRSTIVQIARIREIQPWFGGDYIAILHDGRQLRISRTYRASVLKTIS